jgi:hypothetical protein
MTSAPLRALGAALLTSLLLAAAPAALAATPMTCDKLHGRDLVTGRGIHVVRLKLPTIAPRGRNAGTEDRTGLFSCRLPNGPVHQLATDGQSYFKGQRNTPVESTTVTIGTSAGRFATVTETSNTLIGEAFLTDRVVNAATGHRLYTYLNTSSDPTHPSLAAPLRTLLNPTGTLVGLFPFLDADDNQKTDHLVAFVNSKGQALDTADDGSIPAASITLTGNVVTWTDAGIVKSATIGPVTADSAAARASDPRR